MGVLVEMGVGGGEESGAIGAKRRASSHFWQASRLHAISRY
jgi:hypothetical protein